MVSHHEATNSESGHMTLCGKSNEIWKQDMYVYDCVCIIGNYWNVMGYEPRYPEVCLLGNPYGDKTKFHL